MTRWALGLSVSTAVAEVALLAAAATGNGFGVGDALVILFLVGPPAFLALLLGRRRTAVPWPGRVLLAAGFVAVVGVGMLVLRVGSPLLVPFVQWPAVFAVWVGFLRRERAAKRAGKSA